MTDITRYAHILQALGEGKVVQYSAGGSTFGSVRADTVLRHIADGLEPGLFRIVPSAVTLTYDIPRPMMVRPARGSSYWVGFAYGQDEFTWDGDETDEAYFLAGIYTTEADAQAAEDAHRAAIAALGVK